VFGHVLQRLLRDAEQTERRVARDTWTCHTLPKLDSYAVSTRHATAEICDGRGEPEQFKLRRVKVMRQAVDVANDVPGSLGQTGKTLGERQRDHTRLRAEAVDLHAQQRKLLAQVVVQIACDAVTF
jgi:hypothetical protein